MNIAEALNKIIAIEGEYSDHPDDKGGPTKYGVTEKVARAYGYEGSMKEMPKSMALDIFMQRYWIEPQFDKVAILSERIAEELLDTGINMGQSVGVRFLQRSLNVLNQQGKTFPDVTVDGVLGSLSLYALKCFLQARGTAGELVLYRMMNALQSVRYIEIAEKNVSQESFQYGWQKERVA